MIRVNKICDKRIKQNICLTAYLYYKSYYHAETSIFMVTTSIFSGCSTFPGLQIILSLCILIAPGIELLTPVIMDGIMRCLNNCEALLLIVHVRQGLWWFKMVNCCLIMEMYRKLAIWHPVEKAFFPCYMDLL